MNFSWQKELISLNIASGLILATVYISIAFYIIFKWNNTGKIRGILFLIFISAFVFTLSSSLIFLFNTKGDIYIFLSSIKFLSALVLVFTLFVSYKSLYQYFFTEKRQLNRDDNFLQTILDTSPYSIYVYHLEGKNIIYTNKYSILSFGYTREEIQSGGQFFLKIIHPEDMSKMLQHYKEIISIRDGEIKTIEARFRHADGNWIWLSISESVFKRNKKGKVEQIVGITKDITRRKEAEIKLKESEYFIKKITDAVPHFIIVHDLIENKNVFSNRELQKVSGFGLPLKDIENYNIYSLIHPDDLQAFLEDEKKVLKIRDDEVLEYEVRIRGADGTYRWENMRRKVFKRTEKGEVAQIVISAIDITARKKAEERLEESRKFIEKITETAPDVIYVFDIVNKKNLYINKNSVKEILGYTPEDIKRINDNFLTYLIHPDDFPRIMNHFEKMRNSSSDEIRTIEYRMKDSRGQWHWFIGKDAVFQRDDQVKVSQIAGVATDITYIKKIEDELKDLNINLEKKVKERTKELQKSEENLRQSENQLKLVTNAIPALISYVDNKETYLFANPFYRNLLNVPDDIIGKKIKDVIDSEAYSKGEENFQMALKGETISFENKMAMKDGSIRTLNISFIPDMDEKNKIRGIVIMGVDMTDRIEYEKNLENINIELKRINTDLDNFIYTASHDLKAPIANLEGLINSIMESIKGQINEENLMMMDMMKVSINKLRTTISELTEISKIQRDHGENREVLNIRTMIEDFKSEFSVQIKNSNAVIIPQLDVPNIFYSRKNFRSIIYNLLSNAIKFRSPERTPEIIVKTEKIGEDQVLMTVKDNGRGFNMNQKDKIFGMFKRLHADIEGTGVGLYIVKKIVENSGGQIDVESKVNEGSVFKVYFKIKEQ